MPAVALRHLLFGLFALQNRIINEGQLVAALEDWTLDKSSSLADHLETRGGLTGAKRALLERLSEVHLELHSPRPGNSTRRCEQLRKARPADLDLRQGMARTLRSK